MLELHPSSWRISSSSITRRTRATSQSTGHTLEAVYFRESNYGPTLRRSSSRPRRNGSSSRNVFRPLLIRKRGTRRRRISSRTSKTANNNGSNNWRANSWPLQLTREQIRLRKKVFQRLHSQSGDMRNEFALCLKVMNSEYILI